MKVAGKVAALILAIAFLVLTFTNASWIADAPKGNLRLIANRAIAQQYMPSATAADCTAAHIEEPVHDYIENTGRSFSKARALGAQMVRVDVAFSADGEVVFLADQMLDCRTDGTGPVNGKTLAELQRLDIARGYSADGGKTRPLAGSQRHRMGSLEEAQRILQYIPMLYNLPGDDPQTGERLAAALKASGRDVERVGDAFVGKAGPIGAIRQAYPRAWAWTWEEAETCASDYTRTGWTGSVPESCKGRTMAIPIDRQWPFWGWPNRLSTRMAEAGGRIVMTGPRREDGEPLGLTLPEQLQDVPSTFRGHLLIDDFWTVGTALRPSMDRRTVSEQIEAEKGLERRRARQ